MKQMGMVVADARAAASAFGAFARLTGSTKLPPDRDEFVTRMHGTIGRARPIAAALRRYVEVNGFDALRSALDESAATGHAQTRSEGVSDSAAAAIISRIDFEELDRNAMVFAASGLY